MNLNFKNTSSLIRAISRSYGGIRNDNGIIKPVVNSGNHHVFDLIDKTKRFLF